VATQRAWFDRQVNGLAVLDCPDACTVDGDLERTAAQFYPDAFTRHPQCGRHISVPGISGLQARQVPGQVFHLAIFAGRPRHFHAAALGSDLVSGSYREESAEVPVGDQLPDASAWTLDPDVAYLNHGGFGAAPRSVLAEQQAVRDELERNPVQFLVRRLPGLLADVRTRLAAFLTADEAGLVFVDNATTGTQTVISGIRLGPGDEVLTTDHCYGAALAQLRRAVDAAGATLRIVPVAMPAASREAVAAAVLTGLTGRTRLLVVDHIASCSGLLFPVEEIVAECRRQQVPVLIDGAHATGQVPVDLDRLGADFWTGNLHKWVCAPKASAVLHVAPQWRDSLRPLVASHGLLDGYQPAFDWTGTRDPSSLLATPAALSFFEQAGWENVRAHNNDLARQGADLVAKALGTQGFGTQGFGTQAGAAAGLAAALQVVRLPRELTEAEARELESRLFDEYRVVVPVTFLGGYRWLRLSAQLYNTPDDYQRLADALAPAHLGALISA
jgi:isopenicillin-N epimerase